MTDVRASLDRLLASKPGIDVATIDGQPEAPDHELPDGRTRLGHLAGPWVCVDFADGEQFAIWKTTGNVYRVGEHGAVEDDPIIVAEPKCDNCKGQMVQAGSVYVCETCGWNTGATRT